VITVNGGDGKRSDYAIMKQVQQAKIARATHPIVLLDGNINLAGMRESEALYILSHGDPITGDIREVNTATLVDWLTRANRGLPATYKGVITICSCYGGLKYDHQLGKSSLVERVAAGLRRHVAPGVAVRGANGYSFGTPEFSQTGLSSVLSENLSNFYFLDTSTDESRRSQWLTHKPTHLKGALLAKLGTVKKSLTIRENIQKAIDAKPSLGTVDGIALDCVAAFATEAKDIQAAMVDTIKRIPGDTIVERIEYLEAKDSDPDVVKWNKAIARQYELFQEYYLWAPVDQDFTTAVV
jgi:hypothetical protein